MTKGSKVAKHNKFIKGMINGGTESMAAMIKAYKKAYPTCKKDTTARVNAYKLLQNAAIVKAIDTGVREREAIIKQAQKEEIERLAKEQIASQNQLEALLSQIALGIYPSKKLLAQFNPKTGKFSTAEVSAPVSESDKISAADKLLKIKGAYAKDNVIKHEAGDSWIEAMKDLAKTRGTDDTKAGS